jgi:hypothetical protein
MERALATSAMTPISGHAPPAPTANIRRRFQLLIKRKTMEDCGRIARGDNSLFVGEIFPDIHLNFPVPERALRSVQSDAAHST